MNNNTPKNTNELNKFIFDLVMEKYLDSFIEIINEFNDAQVSELEFLREIFLKPLIIIKESRFNFLEFTPEIQAEVEKNRENLKIMLENEGKAGDNYDKVIKLFKDFQKITGNISKDILYHYSVLSKNFIDNKVKGINYEELSEREDEIKEIESILDGLE